MCYGFTYHGGCKPTVAYDFTSFYGSPKLLAFLDAGALLLTNTYHQNCNILNHLGYRFYNWNVYKSQLKNANKQHFAVAICGLQNFLPMCSLLNLQRH